MNIYGRPGHITFANGEEVDYWRSIMEVGRDRLRFTRKKLGSEEEALEYGKKLAQRFNRMKGD